MIKRNLNLRTTSQDAKKLIYQFPEEAIKLVKFGIKNYPHKYPNDICHDIFIKLIGRIIDKYDGSTNLDTFIVAYAKQQSFNHYKEYYRRNLLQSKYQKLTVINDVIDNAILDNITLREIKDSIDNIENKINKDIIYRRFINGDTLNKISKSHKISITSVNNICRKWLNSQRKKYNV
jgi:RNA polymerase sigma factor (sigma-70 family)